MPYLPATPAHPSDGSSHHMSHQVGSQPRGTHPTDPAALPSLAPALAPPNWAGRKEPVPATRATLR
ncbi:MULTISPECIES: hypothetical protein [unclassified Janibacter]|uniref:hypothetical protein n=1 Tax=unclassified Janibacter TaxID=2649294 RepID=UPI003CFBE6B7